MVVAGPKEGTSTETSIEADFLTNCAFWDMQMRSLARFSDFLGQVLEFLHTVVQASEADLKKID